MQLRPYQLDDKARIYAAWTAGARDVLAVEPTGAGKTVILASVIREHRGAVCAIAHRQELVSQISLALAREGVRHRIIGPQNVVRLCTNIHMVEVGKSFYHPDAVVAVAGVDTLVSRQKNLRPWAESVTFWVMDEAHHLLRANKWGTAVEMFPNARGLGVTATPLRADGNGLGRHADGVFDVMIEGPGMRALIDAGFLTDYRIFAPPSDLNLGDVNITAGGDYNQKGLKYAVRKSRVIGDVVEHYLRIAKGKLGITFATDIETAADIAGQFNAAGVPAAVVHAKTPDAERTAVLRRFRNREVMQLVNVDIFGEGFDLPALEVVSMARPTQSYGMYVQQFGRGLRPMEGKVRALIIDHVGNVARFAATRGLPDTPQVWSLDRREKRRQGATDAIPTRTCLNEGCFSVYERILKACPYCEFVPVPQSRSGPEFVDGDLLELDAQALAILRGEIDKVDLDPELRRAELAARNVPQRGQFALVKRHAARQMAQATLRGAIALWAGYQRHAGRPDSESYRRFYFMFGIDVLSAQALGITEAAQLTEAVNGKLGVT